MSTKLISPTSFLSNLCSTRTHICHSSTTQQTHPKLDSLEVIAPHERRRADPEAIIQVHDPRLEHHDVHNIDEVSHAVSCQPPHQVLLCLVVSEHRAQWDDTGIVHIGDWHHQQPADVQAAYGEKQCLLCFTYKCGTWCDRTQHERSIYCIQLCVRWHLNYQTICYIRSSSEPAFIISLLFCPPP